MRRLWCALALGLLLGIAGSARADEQADLKAVIDKAIKAHGGEANLTKYKAATWKGKGTYHGQGQAIPFSAEWFSQPPGQHTVRVEAEANGMKFAFIEVVNGDKGWSKAGEELKEMDKETLAEKKEQIYANWVASLAPHKDKVFKFTPLGEVEIGKRAAVGVNVARKDHRDVKLFFDKKTGRLLKREMRIKDTEANQEATEEAFYHDYKLMDGVWRACKHDIKRDGKPHVEVEMSEYKNEEKLDDSTFAKP